MSSRTLLHSATLLLAVLLTTSCAAPTAIPNPTTSPIPKATQTPELRTAPAPTPSPEWVTKPSGHVYLNPKSQRVGPGSEFVVNVEVWPAAWGVSACEFGLTFDPGALEITRVKAGDLLGPSPLVGTEKIDNKAGTFTYALARAGTTTAPCAGGILASITFKAGSAAGRMLRVDVIKVGLANEKFEDLKGLQTQGAAITVE